MKKAQKNFNTTIANLYQLGNRIIGLLERDISEFNKYGITEAHVNELRSNIDQFNNLPFDELYEQRQILLSKEKSEKEETLKMALRNLILKIEMAYEQSNVLYLTISRTKLLKLSSSELCVHTKSILIIVEENLDMLSNFGVTTSEIDNLKTLSDELTILNIDREVAIYKRVSATNHRVIEANKIYKQISKYFYMGRKIWAEQSEALYNDYILQKQK